MRKEIIRTAILVSVLAVLFMVSGCASVISKGIAEQADRTITVDMVQANPDLYKGITVIWGGTIIGAQNLEETTEIEVLESELAYDDVPRNGGSKGRFLVEAQGYLDTTIYASSKKLTVAGVIQDLRTRKIGKMDYPYPVIQPLEIKLFEPRPRGEYDDYYDYPPPWWYRRPYGPYYPYPYPYHPGYPWPYYPY